MNDTVTQFTNTCDFPISVYFTRKIGYSDSAMQFERSVPAKASAGIRFENKSTVSWSACHQSQTLCNRALQCIEDKRKSGTQMLGYLTAECSACEK